MAVKITLKDPYRMAGQSEKELEADGWTIAGNGFVTFTAQSRLVAEISAESIISIEYA